VDVLVRPSSFVLRQGHLRDLRNLWIVLRDPSIGGAQRTVGTSGVTEGRDPSSTSR
jgi:hypothetical protein